MQMFWAISDKFKCYPQFVQYSCKHNQVMRKQEHLLSQNQALLDFTKEAKSYESLSNVSNSCASGPQDSFDSADHRKHRFTPSLISYTMHRYKKSLEISEFSFESEQIQMDEFFDDEIILQRKVQKKEVIFKRTCLHPQLVKRATEQIYKFTQNPSDESFSVMISNIYEPTQPIFSDQHLFEQSGGLIQTLEDLLCRQQHFYLIYTFDWTLCHLTFVCLLILYWAQIDFTEFQEPLQDIKELLSPKRKSFVQDQHVKIRMSLSQVTRMYTQERSQQINTNQVVLVLIYYFINLQKQYPFLQIVQLCNTQNKLISDIKLFRRIKRKQKQFNSTCNKVIFESQLHKYEHENKLVQSMEKTYTLLNLITSHNFVSTPLTKYYHLQDTKGSRKQYQNKKDYFCTWVLQIIVKLCQKKSAESLHKSALYIVHFMSILKKMRQECNIEGISYLVPILANLQMLLPKVWNYAIQRRPEISNKFLQYSEFLLKKYSKISELGEKKSILWGETIFELTEKMWNKATKNRIIIQEHHNFYEQFLKDFIFFRKAVQQSYQEEIDNYNRDREIGSSFNMYLLDNYIPKVYRDKDNEKIWKQLKKQAETVNNDLDNSIYIDIIDYCFIGSTYRYSRIDI